jgi:D-glycero-D-manno-heptose 1,7-bisphosphate phosphatase
MAPSKQAVFLDRDGVINRPIIRDGKPYPPASPEEVQILPGVKENLVQLASVGYLLIGITNQPDVARKQQRRDVVEAINQLILNDLPILEILVCYHDDLDGCDCRKPEPGLILRAAKRYDIDLPGSYMVGDRWKDMEAGKRAGCQTIFIDYNYQEPHPPYEADMVLTDVTNLARHILRLKR